MYICGRIKLKRILMNFSTSKKVNTFILSVSVFFILASISCSKKAESSNNEVVFETIQEDKTQSVVHKQSSLKCNLQIKFIYPVNCKATCHLDNLQKLFVGKFFPSSFANLSPQDAVKEFSAKYIQDFESIRIKDFSDEATGKDEIDYIYEQNLEDEILYNQNSFISFLVKSTVYEGGAHAVSNNFGYVIDLDTEHFITEEDFAGKDYVKMLSPILTQKIAAANGIDDVSALEGIGYVIGKIAPNNNFTIDDKGITYYFNEYEIAAYFVGMTEVFIPFEELRAYIIKGSPIASLAGR